MVVVVAHTPVGFCGASMNDVIVIGAILASVLSTLALFGKLLKDIAVELRGIRQAMEGAKGGKSV